MPPFASSKRALHIAKETSKGTAIASPTTSLPVRSFTGNRDKTKLPDMSLRGSAVDAFSEADGVYHGVFSIEGDVFVDSFGHLLLSIMGEEAISGVGPYVHAFTTLNSGDQQPPGHTIWDDYSVVCRRHFGSQLSSLALSWEDNGLLAYSADALTLGDTVVTAPVASYGALAPMAAWYGTCLIGGVAAYPLSGELTITRNDAEPIHVQDGLQSPRYIWVGPLSIEGTLVLLMENDTYYDQFVNNTQPTLALTWTQSASAIISVTMSKATWRTPEKDLSGSYVKLEIPFKALGNTTDVGASSGYSPAKFSLTNSRATVY